MKTIKNHHHHYSINIVREGWCVWVGWGGGGLGLEAEGGGGLVSGGANSYKKNFLKEYIHLGAIENSYMYLQRYIEIQGHTDLKFSPPSTMC